MAMASNESSSGGDRDVFGSLPNTRPQRRSARRDRAGAKAKPAASGPAKAEAAAKATPAARAEPAAGAKPAAQAKAAAQAKPSTGAKAAADTKPGARAKAAAQGKPAAQAQAAAKAAPPRATSSKIPPAGYATPRGDDDGVPHGAELVTTAVQAAGELAQIGLAAGGRALKSALGRLPRP
jgi:chemotaxis protein histidine kinase CheA